MSDPLIVTETHSGGIALYRQKITPVFVEGAWSREFIANLYPTIVIGAGYLTSQNIKLRLPGHREKSVGNIKLYSHKGIRHIMINMICQ